MLIVIQLNHISTTLHTSKKTIPLCNLKWVVADGSASQHCVTGGSVTPSPNPA